MSKSIYGKKSGKKQFKKNIAKLLHNILKITFFFDQTIFTQLLWTLGTNLPTKTDIFVASLDPTTNRLKNLSTVIRTLKISLILETFLKKPVFSLVFIH